MIDTNIISGSLARIVSEPKPYYTKTKLQKLIKRCDGWVRKWESIIMIDCELKDYKKFYKPNKGVTYHQACVLAIVSDWRNECLSASDEEIIELIKLNREYLTLQSIMSSTSGQPQKEASTELALVA